VSPTDPLVFAGIAIVALLVALVANYLPARRATRIDPVEMVRY
jgi:ABC-type antimicrobial peptide transport system permease subunit